MKSAQKLFLNHSDQTYKKSSDMPVWLVFVLLVFSLSSAQAQDPTRFENEIRAFEQIDQVTAPPEHSVLFTGSSSIRVWPDLPGDFNDYPAMNRGFGGSHMSDLVYYFDRVVAAYDPAIVLVYEGDNDLAGGKSVDQVYADYLEFMALVETHLPQTDVAFIATKPSPSRSQYVDVSRDLNTRLQALAASDPDIWFVDVFTPMLNAHDEPRAELFGNTRAWSGLSEIFPSFKLTGLMPSQAYRMTFYASRMGVSDKRETGYTIVGKESHYVVLDPANNLNNLVSIGGVKADASGEITISIAPTENNTNSYHFTYLGVLTLRPEGGR